MVHNFVVKKGDGTTAPEIVIGLFSVSHSELNKTSATCMDELGQLSGHGLHEASGGTLRGIDRLARAALQKAAPMKVKIITSDAMQDVINTESRRS